MSKPVSPSLGGLCEYFQISTLKCRIFIRHNPMASRLIETDVKGFFTHSTANWRRSIENTERSADRDSLSKEIPPIESRARG
jgi:hypothetical protein